MSDNKTATSALDKIYDPIFQAIYAFGSVVVFSLVAKAIDATGLMSISDRFPWMSAASFMLLFAVGNSVFSLVTPDMLRYWGRSVYSFMGLAVASGLSAWLLSSLPIGEAGSYRWIFIVVTIGYLVFLSIMNMIRRIVEFAQKEEWNNPRIRRGNSSSSRRR